MQALRPTRFQLARAALHQRMRKVDDQLHALECAMHSFGLNQVELDDLRDLLAQHLEVADNTIVHVITRLRNAQAYAEGVSKALIAQRQADREAKASAS